MSEKQVISKIQGGEYARWEQQYFPGSVLRVRGIRPLAQKQLFRVIPEQIGVYSPHGSKLQMNLKEKFLQVNNEEDDRERITDMKYPYSSIGFLSFTFDGKHKCHGSGFLIGPNIVLTAAHNVIEFVNNKKIMAKDLYFYPCVNEKVGQKIQVQSFEFPDQHKEDSLEWDFAVLRLSQSIHLTYGILGLDFSKQGKQGECFLYGYPGQVKPKNSNNLEVVTKQMFGTSGKYWVHGQTLRYQITSSKGQSGSPIWIEKDGEYYIIGIHSQSGGDKQDYNEGVLLTDRVRKRINKWLGKQVYEELNLNPTKQHEFENKQRTKLTHQSLQGLIKKYENLKEIYLYDHQIGEKGVQTLCDSKTYLQKLSIGRNNLKQIPKEIKNLRMLTHLFVMDNHIKKLPQELFTLYNLETLWVSNNQISQLDSKIGRLNNLNQLYANNNKLKFLPTELFEIAKLSVLNVSNNLLSQLPENIGKASQLTFLNVSNNKLKKFPESIKNLEFLAELKYEDNDHQLVIPENMNSGNQVNQFDALPDLPQQIQKFLKESGLK